MSTDSIIAIAAVALIAAIIYGFVRKIKNNGFNSTEVTDALVLEVKKIVGREIHNVLQNAGIATDYEGFKDYIIRALLKKVREYFDKKGGAIDEITDALDDDSIIDAINVVIEMSGIEDEIKQKYDDLINARLKEIEESDSEVEAENNKIETEDLSLYEEEDNKSPIDESEPEVKVDEE